MTELNAAATPLALRALVLAAAGTSALVVAAAADDAPPAPPARFAKAASCAPCHERESRLWSVSFHARSTEPAREDNVPAEMAMARGVSHGAGRTVFARDGDTLLAETVGDDGLVDRFPVEYVVGRRRMTMLVTRLADGRTQVLPAMREDPDGPWFDYTDLLFAGPGAAGAAPPVVAPGEPSFWTGPDRSFDARCARCHTSGYEPLPPPPGGAGPRSRWRAPGVDCDACHGAGQDHVDLWTKPPRDAFTEPLAPLASLDRDASVSLCLWCHMESEVVDPAFRIGADVLDHLDPTLLDQPDRVDATGRPVELVYEGVSFLASECATRGALTCLTCHDPHGSEHTALLRVPPARTDELCASCHPELVAKPEDHGHHSVAESGGRCIACHMTPLTIERGHGTVHDHTIGVPRPFPNPGESARDACTWCHQSGRGAPGDAPALTTERLQTSFRGWWPEATGPRDWEGAIAEGRARDPTGVAALREVIASPATPRVVRASAVRLLGGYAGEAAADLLALARHDDPVIRRAAVGALAQVTGPEANRALLAALSDRSPGVRGAAARAALTGWERVRADRELCRAVVTGLEEETRAVPEDHLRWFRLGAARQLAGDLAGALLAYERKLDLDPGARRVAAEIEKLRARLARERLKETQR